MQVARAVTDDDERDLAARAGRRDPALDGDRGAGVSRQFGNPVTRRHIPAIVAGALCLVNACASAPRAGPALQERGWPAYLGSARRAADPADAPGRDPQAVWRVRVSRGISGAPALGETVLAVAQTDKQVALLDRATGTVLWRRRTDQPLGAGPLIADDRLFVAEQTTGARIRALRLSDGGEIWARAAGDIEAPLALDGEALYAASTGGTVTRLRALDGERVWRVRLPGGVRTAPVPLGDALAVATAADSIFLLDAASGAVRARRGTRGTVLAAPAAAGDLLVVGTTAGRLEAFDAATFGSRWTVDLDGPIVGSVAASAGRFYALTARGTLAIVGADGPASVRRVATGIVARAGPAPALTGVYLAAATGELVLVDSTGTRLWTAQTGGPVSDAPQLDARTIIAVSRRGDVVMFR